jgi:aspartate aminotransferase
MASVLEGERRAIASQTSKKYVGIAGDPTFCDLHQVLTFGDEHPARQDRRIRTIQTPGGSGGLRVAAELLSRVRPGQTVWVSEPTWPNHIPLLGAAGLKLERYPYYDTVRRQLDADGMLTTLIERACAGDVVLLHGCCHNPTGEDLGPAEWSALADLCSERQLLPFVDLAYQGFGRDLDADVAGLRLLAGKLPEMLVVNSCSKNFSLYRDRVGSLSAVCANAGNADTVASHMSSVARGMYSMPPHHGAGIVAEVLGDPALADRWRGELAAVCGRVRSLRRTLADALAQRLPDHDFGFLTRQQGMFSLLGVDASTIERLRVEHHVYVVGSGRINLAGLGEANVGFFADALSAALR